MRVLLDECVPVGLADSIVGHEVVTVRDERWQGRKNGELIPLVIAAGFEAFVTTDKNLRYQQDLRDVGIGVIVMRGFSNSLAGLLPIVPELHAALTRIAPGGLIEIGPLAGRRKRRGRRGGGPPPSASS